MSSLRPFCLTSWLAVPATAVLLLLTPAAHAQTPAAQPATPAPAQSPDPAPAAPSQTTVAARSPEQRGVTSRAIDKVKEVAKSAADIFSRVPCLPPKGGSKAMGSLPHVASKLAAGQPVVIVAFGSSSTQGFGASSPEFNYPNRLAAQLRRHYPTADISVINAGVGGEDAPEMMKRLQTQVIDRHPDLVIWQVGTNAVLRNLDPADTAKLVEDGISRIQAAGGTDIVLVDPQYSPAVNQRKESAGKMIKLLGNVAELRKVGIFPRFEVMRDWHENQSIPVEGFVIADGLHMNDWGYACFAQLLGDDIIRSVGQIKLGVSVPADVRTYRPM
ncbi:SGNH/GDSL hydrolase family protein [Bradyrhizobium sp. IC3069]|uniref:SGNH/GDSL hydrolase family protein n=1 Tax=Bradyrhizobium TaxID=374 RepID=UPI001CD57A88|nr:MULTISPECIES: SGNH/GDSL hydrolase family protein [unclassified Bradyrhizobium]MCA1363734.1 SGNH/GDSL hydrolase family protein [Bradyrhizobium sp. IC4059]MCA1377396.1 SGNH/GDSL hydrolase family protein [Bradyrhizobium sp. IC4060]MCA1485949.1 SGNH/GDSL hydrolase family protein [Bradyrhizobium sp. IC4061]MCA1521201.1 SGNH/GDSL hydrolase family protein [Bradyrhizobium sp. IC3069]MCA1541998.1 SGNH/GDSL hydrolase family protein [Bradyrhizobium sp. NBAIM32]